MLLVFPVVFSLYLFTLSPGIYVGDSALFAASSFALGTAHPPAYPLYNVIGKASTFLPIGNIAYRVNFLSLLFGVISACLVSLIIFRITSERLVSIIGGVTAALLPVIWWESLKAEVYTLNSALSLFILYQGIMMLKGSDVVRRAFISAFVFGLGFGNHHTIGFVGLSLLVPFIIHVKTLRGKLLLLPAFFLIGFSVNLYTYLRSLNWLNEGNLMTYSPIFSWKQFMAVFLRKYYEGGTIAALQTASYKSSWLYGIKNFFTYIAFDNLGYLLFLSLPGVLYIFRKDKKTGFFILTAFLGSGLLLSAIALSGREQTEESIYIVKSYFLPSLYIQCILAVSGFAYASSFKGRFAALRRPLLVIVFSIPLIIFPVNFKKSALHDSFTAYDHGRDLFNALPVKSLFFIGSDSSAFGAFYMNSIERLREDVLVFGPSGKKKSSSDIAPVWKYGKFYPDFFKGNRMSGHIVKEYSPSFRLQAYRPFSFQEFGLKGLPYGLTSVLISENLLETKKNNVEKKFIKNFENLNYERALDITYMDYLARELAVNYFLVAAHGAYLKKEFGVWQKLIELFPEGCGYYLWHLKETGADEERKAFARFIFRHSDSE